MLDQLHKETKKKKKQAKQNKSGNVYKLSSCFLNKIYFLRYKRMQHTCGIRREKFEDKNKFKKKIYYIWPSISAHRRSWHKQNCFSNCNNIQRLFPEFYIKKLVSFAWKGFQSAHINSCQQFNFMSSCKRNVTNISPISQLFSAVNTVRH